MSLPVTMINCNFAGSANLLETFAMADLQMDQMIAGFLTGIEGKPGYAVNLVGLAEVVLGKKDKLQAFELARRALEATGSDTAVAARARAILGSLLPGYHVPMMNDARRNAAWDTALR